MAALRRSVVREKALDIQRDVIEGAGKGRFTGMSAYASEISLLAVTCN